MHANAPDRLSRSSKIARASLLGLLLLLAFGCAGNPREESSRARDAATLRVDNQAWSQMTMYVVAGGQRVRLGSVSPSSTAALRIPASVVGLGRGLTFVADPVGSDRRATSFEIYVRPGEVINLTIPPQAG